MKPHNMKKFVPLIILLGLIITAWALGLHQSFNLETLQSQKEQFQNYTENNPLFAAAMFTGAYIIIVALSLPIASLVTLLGGFLFGKWLGTLLVVTGATIGATIIFLIAKTSLGSTLREKAGTAYKKIEGNMQENAAGYLLFMRLVPLFPFWFVNIVPALVNVKLRIFVLTTFFGIIPGSFVYVNVGEELGEINTLNDIFSPGLLAAFALLGVFALIPTIYKKIKGQRHE